MNQELLTKQIVSILKDLECLSGTVKTMSTVTFPDAKERYEDLSIRAAQQAEWIAIRLRHLLYDSTSVRAADYMPRAVDALGIAVEEQDGIYKITLPGLAPKRRSRRSDEFLIDPLMFALSQYAEGHAIIRHPHYMVCFVLVYDRTLPTRRVRDYDNLELKPVLDAATMFLMESDTGLLCDTYHSTELGDRDCTQVFVMGSRRFPAWYAERQQILAQNASQQHNLP